jgi:hypothetical protein
MTSEALLTQYAQETREDRAVLYVFCLSLSAMALTMCTEQGANTTSVFLETNNSVKEKCTVVYCWVHHSTNQSCIPCCPSTYTIAHFETDPYRYSMPSIAEIETNATTFGYRHSTGEPAGNTGCCDSSQSILLSGAGDGRAGFVDKRERETGGGGRALGDDKLAAHALRKTAIDTGLIPS